MSGVAWKNWSGSVVATPSRMEMPTSVAQLQQIIADAVNLRVAGQGHASMPLCSTQGVLLSLDALDETITVAESEVWVPAGWSLAKVGEALAEQGLALPCLPDFDAQTLGGALATGSHGSGASYGCLATMVTGFRLVLPGGSLITCSSTENDEIFAALKLSLGALGAIVAVRLATVPAFRLSRSTRRLGMRDLLANWDGWVSSHRHVAFWHFPYADDVLLTTFDKTDALTNAEPGPSREKHIARLLSLGQRITRLRGLSQKLVARQLDGKRTVGPAHRMFATVPLHRFEAMEYAVPATEGLRALRAVIREIRKRQLDVMLPLKVQYVRGDAIALSPFSGGDRVTITVYQSEGVPPEPLFDAVEPVFRAFAGRPHWGMRHTLVARDLERLYPGFRDWLAVRARLDPAGKLLNPCLRSVLGA
jgi:FAD-linked oxidoreductase